MANHITYQNKNYNNVTGLLRAVSTKEGKNNVKNFYDTFIFTSDICPRCMITDRKLTYETYKSCGLFCGVIIKKTFKKYKDKEKCKSAIKNFIYVEEINNYFSGWAGIALCMTKNNFPGEQKKAIYDKYILDDTKCRLASCDNKVPYEQTRTNACCTLHYNRDSKLKKGVYTTDDLTYQCAIDGEKFPSLSRLSLHIAKLQMPLEDYYKKYVDPSATGTCKWCCKPVPFHNIEAGYRNFCHNSSCNVLWHNKFENRNDNGEKISQRQKELQNMPNQKGYWLKRGYTEEEAKEKVRERQTTNSVEAIARRHECSFEEATEIRKGITKKWMDSNKSSVYSKVSQELFWSIYEKIKQLFDPSDIFFATFNNGAKEDTGKTLEYKVQTSTTYRRLDFFIKSINKCIEFDGAYWHDERNRRGTQNDQKRDQQIVEAINCKILHIPEMDYYKDKQKILNTCLEFLLEPSVLKEIKQTN
jgi:very-short-patch-repair endonuclease